MTDVDDIFDKLKETGDDEDDRKEVFSLKKSSSEVKKPKQDQRSPNKVTTEEISSLAKFQPDTEWSKIKANTVKHLKESTANLRVMIKELNEAK